MITDLSKSGLTSEGYLSIILRNLKLKARIFSDRSDIVDLSNHHLHAMIVHPQDIAFSALKDNKIFSYYCEHSFINGSAQLLAAYSESYRTQQYYIYALNSNYELVVYDAHLTSKSEESGCRMMAKLQLPEKFTKGGTIGLVSLRGALFIQSQDGGIMILDTSLGSLLQEADFTIFNPKYLEQVESGAQVSGPIQVREVKISETVKGKSSFARNSFVAVRVPGSMTKLAIFEHNTDSQVPSDLHNPALQNDYSGGNSLIMMAFAVGIVITCMNIGNISKKKRTDGGNFGGGFGSSRRRR